MREGNTSRVMAADRPYRKFYDFDSVSRDYFGYSFVYYLDVHDVTRCGWCKIAFTAWCRVKVKLKEKFTLEQAKKAQIGSRSIVVLLL
jgi:hypothetical protein